MVILKNEKLTVKVAIHGAELKSVVDNVTGYEYMWQADPARTDGRRSRSTGRSGSWTPCCPPLSPA